MQSCFRACALRLHTGTPRESAVSVGTLSLSPACHAQQSSWVLAADLSSGRWQGMDFGEETRPGLDPKHNWETPRSNCTTSLGAKRNAYILLGRDNELTKFGVFVSVWLHVPTRGHSDGKAWNACNIIYHNSGYYKLYLITADHWLIHSETSNRFSSIRS